jgi:hypothetical protein
LSRFFVVSFPYAVFALAAVIVSACAAPPRADAGNDAVADAVGDCDGGTCTDAQYPDCPPVPVLGFCGLPRRGQVCQYATQRCSCVGAGGLPEWYCESLECPTTQLMQGASCPRDGLVCSPGFESDCRCVGPELVWNCCWYGWRCPQEPPQDGSLCCGVLLMIQCDWNTDGGTVRAFCEGAHWRLTTVAGDAGSDGDDAITDGGAMDAGIE